MGRKDGLGVGRKDGLGVGSRVGVLVGDPPGGSSGIPLSTHVISTPSIISPDDSLFQDVICVTWTCLHVWVV